MTNRAKDNQQKQKVAESAYFESKNQSNFDSVNNKNEKKEMKN